MGETQVEVFRKAKKNMSFFMKEFLNFFPRVDQVPVLTAIQEGAKRILICKGRRWGGTKLCSGIAITVCAQKAATRCGIFGPGWEAVDVFMEQVTLHLERSGIHASIVEAQKRKIIFSNGSVIIGRICSPTAHGKRGRGFDLMIFTEAAFIMDSELHVVRMSKLDNPNAIEIQESSPNGLNHFNVSYNDPDFVSFKFRSEMNTLISKKELKIERDKMTRIQAAQELDAEFIDDSTVPFPQILIDEAIKTTEIDEWWTRCEKQGLYVAGLDLGRKRDKSVLFIWKVEKGGNLQGVLLKSFTYNPDDPRFWSKVIDASEYHCKDFKVQLLKVDCTGLGDKVVSDMKLQFADNGTTTKVEGFNFSYSSKNKWEGLINQFALKFERYKVHFPFHIEFIKQLKSIRFNSEKALFESIGKSPDCVMAAALGALAAPVLSDFFYSKTNAPSEKKTIERSSSPTISYAGIT